MDVVECHRENISPDVQYLAGFFNCFFLGAVNVGQGRHKKISECHSGNACSLIVAVGKKLPQHP